MSGMRNDQLGPNHKSKPFYKNALHLGFNNVFELRKDQFNAPFPTPAAWDSASEEATVLLDRHLLGIQECFRYAKLSIDHPFRNVPDLGSGIATSTGSIRTPSTQDSTMFSDCEIANGLTLSGGDCGDHPQKGAFK